MSPAATALEAPSHLRVGCLAKANGSAPSPVATAVSSASRKTVATPTGTTATCIPGSSRIVRGSASSRRLASPVPGAPKTPWLVSLVLRAYLAAEEAVDDDEVHRREHHADAPPDQTHRLAVIQGGAVGNVEPVPGIPGGETFR